MAWASLVAWALVIGLGVLLLMHGPVAHADTEGTYERCTVTVSNTGDIYLNDCDTYTTEGGK